MIPSGSPPEEQEDFYFKVVIKCPFVLEFTISLCITTTKLMHMNSIFKTIATVILVCYAAVSYSQEPPPAEPPPASPAGNNVSPAGVKQGDKKDGGIVYWVDGSGEHGLIVWEKDLGIIKWEAAVEACQKLGAGWHMPTKDELDKLYTANLELKILSSYFFFHSSTEAEPGYVWRQSLRDGALKKGYRTGTASTAAVRSF